MANRRTAEQDREQMINQLHEQNQLLEHQYAETRQANAAQMAMLQSNPEAYARYMVDQLFEREERKAQEKVRLVRRQRRFWLWTILLALPSLIWVYATVGTVLQGDSGPWLLLFGAPVVVRWAISIRNYRRRAARIIECAPNPAYLEATGGN